MSMRTADRVEPAQAGEPARTQLPKSRIETLCDGVFAIAMTLMVFNIKVPSLSGAAGAAGLAHALFALWRQFLAYALSFVMLGVYWVGHHNQFHYFRRSDRVLLWINILFLMFVTLIPFTTQVLGQYATQPVAVIVYAGNLILAGLTLHVQWWYATAGHRLVDANLDSELDRLAKSRILMGTLLLLFAIALSFVSVAASLLVCAAVPVFYILPGRIDRHWSRDHGHGHSSS